MSFLDFFKKKADNEPKNINVPTDNQPNNASPNETCQPGRRTGQRKHR